MSIQKIIFDINIVYLIMLKNLKFKYSFTLLNNLRNFTNEKIQTIEIPGITIVRSVK